MEEELLGLIVLLGIGAATASVYVVAFVVAVAFGVWSPPLLYAVFIVTQVVTTVWLGRYTGRTTRKV